MFLNSWSLALGLCSLVVLFLVGFASRSAVRVLRFWNPDSDDNRQIRLESEIWLSSTLIEYAMGVQILTLVLFILAADHFSQAMAGAMCATGALLANAYGMPALLIKLVGVFLYGFWIVLHKLDISSETYPLVRGKYIYLLCLLPLLLADITLEALYIANLKPDIITSCCAVVFSDGGGEGGNLLGDLPQGMMLGLFYGTMAVLAGTGFFLLRRWQRLVAIIYGCGWLFFTGLAMAVLITVLSSYIYAMPFHNCPFCILKPEYHSIGFGIYGSLLTASFFGMAGAIVEPFKKRPELYQTVTRFQSRAVIVSLTFLVVFAVLSSYHYVTYMVMGGES